MPILRSDQSPDFFAPHVLFLWRRKWWILLPTIAAFILTYLVLRAVPSDYQANAELFVNRQAYIDTADPNPLTVAALLKSDEVLKQVRDEFAEKFSVPPPIFEKFVRQFTVKTEVLQDTATRKDMSPVVELRVQQRGINETRFLMEAWLSVFIARHGNYVADEARLKLISARAVNQDLETQIRDLEARQAALLARIPFEEKLLAEKISILAPADLQLPRPQMIAPQGDGANNVQVSMDVRPASPRATGLVARLADLEVSASGSTTNSAAQQRETEALRKTIASLTSEIDVQSSKVEALRRDFAATTRQLAISAESQRQLHKDIDTFQRSAAVYHTGDTGPYAAGGDVRVISAPVTPELRVWPQRTLMAALAAIVIFLLTVAAVMSQRYLAHIARQELRDADRP